MSVALIAMVVFALRAWLVDSPWQYVIYGLLAEFLLIWALRPNIKRLLAGGESLHGWLAKGSSRWGGDGAVSSDGGKDDKE